MYTLIRFNKNNNIQNFITQNIALFHSYNSVYLFGSSLDTNTNPKDIDLLLVYSAFFDEIVDETKQICFILEKALSIPVDLTVLSLEELKTTDFLKKIINYIKLK